MVASPLQFVVTGAARSGTAYIARVLTQAGVPTGHEQWFGAYPGLRGATPVKRSTVWEKLKAPASRLRVEIRRRTAGLTGDSSWLAAPHLPNFSGFVYLQVRHPLKVVGSLVGQDFFGRSNVDNPYRRYVGQHLDLTGDVLVDSARYWVEWNRFIISFADRVWRLEQLDALQIAEVLNDLDMSSTSERAATALSSVSPTNTANECGFRRAQVEWDDFNDPLRSEVAELAAAFGYDVSKRKL